MKKHSLVFAGILFIANSVAFAGPDWQIIEKARAEKKYRAEEKAVLAIDHGPHAQTTPWANQIKQQSTEQTISSHNVGEQKQGS